ncbi:EamA/RhaT family transporter [Streptacidiphilus monticola]|uniref:EamA/RhaT family transporter n=1 Tax=Streptacidiphilus monticola TaxID=2161674 RepID=A0ABW1FXL2_9ACTN
MPNQPSSPAVPDPIRFFGTTWVDRGGAYWVRRVLVSVGALACAVAGAFLLRFAVQGVFLAKVGSLVETLLIAAIAVCTCIAAVRTWNVLSRGKESLSGWMADEKSLGAILVIGFVGSLAAYFFRSLVEAPGESVRRARYELARAKAARRAQGQGAKPRPKRRR